MSHQKLLYEISGGELLHRKNIFLDKPINYVGYTLKRSIVLLMFSSLLQASASSALTSSMRWTPMSD